MNRYYAMFLVCLLQCLKLTAATDTAQLLHFDLNNGFPTNNVYSVIQDKLGYIWFATDNGAVKYNGYSFKIFNTSNGLPANDVYRLLEDKRGRVWVYTLTYQLGYVRDNKYVSLSLKTQSRILYPSIIADNGEFLFFIYRENYFYNLAIVKNDLIAAIPIINLYADSKLKTLPFLHLAVIDPRCKLWGMGYDNAVYEYDLLRPDLPCKKACDIDYKMYPFFANGKLSASGDGYLHCYIPKADTVYHINMKNCSYSATALKDIGAAGGESIYTFIEGAVGSTDKVVITNKSTYTFDSSYHLKSREKNDSIIPSQAQVTFAFQDRAHNFWYPTNREGVWCRLKKYYTLQQLNYSLSRSTDIKNVGILSNTPYWWDKATLSLFTLNGKNTLDKLSFPQKVGLNCISDSRDSFVYFGLTNGIYKYNKVNKKLASITAPYPNTVLYDFVLSKKMTMNSDTAVLRFFANETGLLSYSQNCLYAVGPDGFLRIDFYKDSLVAHKIVEDRLSNMFLDSINKKIWCFNTQKLFIYDPVNGKHIMFGSEYLNKFGIYSINNIEIDKYNNIYVGHNEGILIYNLSLNRTISVKRNFNFSGTVFHIRDNEIIVAGKYGVSEAVIKGPLSIGKFFVLPNVNYYYYNRLFDFTVNANNEILLNTDKGFYSIPLSILMKDDGLLDPSSPDFMALILKYPFEKKIEPGDTIMISQKIEKLNFDVINYYGKGEIAYKYRVNGPNKTWQQSDGEIFVSALSAGNYYKVTCMITDDLWEKNELSFYVFRPPYWWQTTTWKAIFWISGVIVVMMLLLVIILITRAIVARANEKKRVLIELELRAVYAQINPHFIFNTLSAAQFFINKKRFDDAYIHVSKFSRLLRAYLKSSQDRYITLDEEVQMLKNYIELQQTRFEEKFEYRLEIENKIPANSIKIPSLLLQPLVENAINHGLFHKESGGLLILKFLQGAKNDELVCIIEDNGIGRKQAEILKKESSASRDSYGTKLTQQLINIYREYEKMDIYLEYIDKTEPETGTIVKLTIKNVKYVA